MSVHKEQKQWDLFNSQTHRTIPADASLMENPKKYRVKNSLKNSEFE